MVDEDSKVFFNLLIDPFCLSICLWVKGHGCIGLDLEQVVEVFHDLETNTVPQSEITTWGILCLAYTSSRKILAHPSDDSSVEHVIGMISFKNRSMIIKIVS